MKPQYATVGETVSIEVRYVGTALAERGGTFTFAFGQRANELAALLELALSREQGGAALNFVPRIPGTYRVGVRLPAATRALTPADASLTVLPPRR